MSKPSRRKLTAEFKNKVCVEAPKEQQTIEALAKKYDPHATQIKPSTGGKKGVSTKCRCSV